MTWHGPEFVIQLVAIATAGWLVSSWIRARHGYAIEDEWGGKTERADAAAATLLQAENHRLSARIAALERRTAALETIVTDSGYDIARQIGALADEHPVSRVQAKELR